MHILVIDEGTTSTRAVFFNIKTQQADSWHSVEFPQIYPQSGWVEHNPTEIWNATLEAINVANKNYKIAAIGITNQRETVVSWNKKTGESAYNAIVWQDRRTAQFCDQLKNDKKTKDLIARKTGLVCDPYFSGTKMKWLLENSKQTSTWHDNNELCMGTIDSFLVYKLSGGVSFATEHTNASRTMVYNLETGKFDSELLNLFGIKENCLPAIRNSTEKMCVTKNIPGLEDGIPVVGILGDQQSALFGQDCTEEGQAKITFGTGAFLLMNTGKKLCYSNDGLLSTVAMSHDGKRTFALEGAAFIAGAAVQFLRDNFGWFEKSSESEKLALQDARDANVVFVPALAGLGSPYWNPYAKGVLFGLSRGTTKSQVTRAVLESIALQNTQLLSLMSRASGNKITTVGVDGGASSNNSLMQFQADILQTKLTRPKFIETTATGAFKAALLGLGETLQANHDDKDVFTPQMKKDEALAVTHLWNQAANAVDKFYSSII